jgi:DtxR family Mn-dependent transcriptional regulator
LNGLKITISKENYLKAIAEAESEGEIVIAAALARWLRVSPPAVTMAIRRLKRDGLITVEFQGVLRLTDAGRAIANRLLNRHHLIERMLSEVFGMEWYKVHEEAEQLEHAVSADFEQKLIEKLGATGVCPHGNILEIDTPGSRRSRGLLPLAECASGVSARVVSVGERDRRLLEHLDGLGVRPGAEVRLLEHNADETVTVSVAGHDVALGRPAAERVWVEPLTA